MMSSEAVPPVFAGASGPSNLSTNLACAEVEVESHEVSSDPETNKSPRDIAGLVSMHEGASVLITHHWDCLKPSDFHNLTPWVTTVFFLHSYFCYLYVFFMIVFSYFKSYALEHPEWRKWTEILLIISIPGLQHARFFFGYWGCQLGLPIDIAVFLSFCPIVMSLLMYFRFNQMYILPIEHTLLFIALWLVALEAFSGVVNALQVLKIMPCRLLHRFALWLSICCSLAAVVVLVLLEMTPQMSPEEVEVPSDVPYDSVYDWLRR
jgi:hypothetical protein